MTSLRDRTPEPWQAPRASQPVDLSVSLPGSKSITNRALVLAALADGPAPSVGALRSRDTTLMADALTVPRRRASTPAARTGRSPRPPCVGAGRDRLRARGHGDAVPPPGRGAGDRPRAFDGDPHMRDRPGGRGAAARCAALGAVVDDDGRGALPFTVHGTGRCPAAGRRSTPRPRPSSSRPCCSPAPATTTGSTSATTASRCRPCRTSR